MRYPVLRLVLLLAFLQSGAAHAYTAEEMEEMEEQRIQQALENLASTKYDQVENATFKFEQMGEEAVPRLVGILHNEKTRKPTARNIIYVLGRIGPASKQAVAVIVPYLKDEDRDTRAVAAIALGKIGPGARDGVSILTKLLYDDDAWVRESALVALGRIRTEAALRGIKDYKDALPSDSANPLPPK